MKATFVLWYVVLALCGRGAEVGSSPDVEILKAIVAANDKRYEERYAAQRDAITAAFAAQKDAVNAALAAADRAVTKAEAAVEKRLENVNEFRAAMLDIQTRLMPRAEATVMISGLTERLGELAKQQEKIQSERVGLGAGWGMAVGVVGFVVLIASVWWALQRSHGPARR